MCALARQQEPPARVPGVISRMSLHGDPRPGLGMGWNAAPPPSAARSCQRSVSKGSRGLFQARARAVTVAAT